MITLWLLMAVGAATVPPQPAYHYFRTEEKCQEQIDSLPEQERRTINGVLWTCVPVYYHGKDEHVR